jgi:hypothetical protein
MTLWVTDLNEFGPDAYYRILNPAHWESVVCLPLIYVLFI